MGEQVKYEELVLLAKKSPKVAKQPLEQLKQAHPDLPEIANLLSFVYLQLKEIENAERLTQEIYERHPDYFIGKLNYADHCLRNQKEHLVPEIFRNTPLPPSDRSEERRGFMVVMGFYHLAIGDKIKAEQYHQSALEIAPDHPSVQALGKKLFAKKSLFERLPLARFFQKS